MPKDQPHVACYLRRLDGGGAQRVMVNLMNSFIKQGIKVDLILNKVEGPYLAQVPSEVSIIDLQAPQLLKGLPKLVQYLRQESPGALLSFLHYTNEIALWAKRLANVPTRVVVSERNTLSVRAKNQTSSERWSPILARLFYPWADGIVANSQGVAKDLAQVTHLPLERIQIIYNPTVSPHLLEKSQELPNHPWFKKGEPPVIMGVGRLDPQKDFPTLIKAFAQVRNIKSCRLMILGEGREKDQLNELIVKLGREKDIVILDFVQNPYAYMAKAAVFVLSSIEEGLPNALIEALAIGTPVISTNCQSGPDEILDNGKYGTLVSVGDSQKMAEAILSVLSGNNIEVADADWIKQFTPEAVAQKYLDVLGISRH